MNDLLNASVSTEKYQLRKPQIFLAAQYQLYNYLSNLDAVYCEHQIGYGCIGRCTWRIMENGNGECVPTGNFIVNQSQSFAKYNE